MKKKRKSGRERNMSGRKEKQRPWALHGLKLSAPSLRVMRLYWFTTFLLLTKEWVVFSKFSAQNAVWNILPKCVAQTVYLKNSPFRHSFLVDGEMAQRCAHLIFDEPGEPMLEVDNGPLRTFFLALFFFFFFFKISFSSVFVSLSLPHVLQNKPKSEYFPCTLSMPCLRSITVIHFCFGCVPFSEKRKFAVSVRRKFR